MDCIAHGVTKSQTQLSDFHFLSGWIVSASLDPEAHGNSAMGLGQFQRFLSCDLGTGHQAYDLGRGLHNSSYC